MDFRFPLIAWESLAHSRVYFLSFFVQKRQYVNVSIDIVSNTIRQIPISICKLFEISFANRYIRYPLRAPFYTHTVDRFFFKLYTHNNFCTEASTDETTTMQKKKRNTADHPIPSATTHSLKRNEHFSIGFIARSTHLSLHLASNYKFLSYRSIENGRRLVASISVAMNWKLPFCTKM